MNPLRDCCYISLIFTAWNVWVNLNKLQIDDLIHESAFSKGIYLSANDLMNEDWRVKLSRDLALD